MQIQHDSALWNQTWQCERRDHCTCCGPMRAEHESCRCWKTCKLSSILSSVFIHTAIQRLTHLYHRLGTQPERSVSRSSIQRCGSIRWTCRSRRCGSFTDTKVWTGWINIIEHLGKIWTNMDLYIYMDKNMYEIWINYMNKSINTSISKTSAWFMSTPRLPKLWGWKIIRVNVVPKCTVKVAWNYNWRMTGHVEPYLKDMMLCW